MIKKILGFLNIFLSLKIKFFKPEKADILLYDQGIRFNYLFQKSFEDIKFQIFYKRLEEINIYILIKAILNNPLDASIEMPGRGGIPPRLMKKLRFTKKV